LGAIDWRQLGEEFLSVSKLLGINLSINEVTLGRAGQPLEPDRVG